MTPDLTPLDARILELARNGTRPRDIAKAIDRTAEYVGGALRRLRRLGLLERTKGVA